MLNLEIKPTDSSKEISQLSFEIGVANSTLGYSEGFNYFFEDKNQKLNITPSQVTPEQVNDAKSTGGTMGSVSKYSSYGFEFLSLLEVVFDFSNTGMFMNFS